MISKMNRASGARTDLPTSPRPEARLPLAASLKNAGISKTQASRWQKLTALERSEHIAEWVRLTGEKVKAQIAPSGHPRGEADKGINTAVRDLGLDRTDAQRSIQTQDRRAPCGRARLSSAVA